MTDTTKRRATFADLAKQNYEFEITSPRGDTLVFEMQPLTAGALLDILRTYPEPAPPVKDVRPNPSGNGFSLIYDYEDAGYKVGREEWFRKVQGANVLRSLVGEVRDSIPGETEAEQIAYLVDGLASWAWAGLYRASQMLTAVKEGQVTLRSFQPNGSADPTGLRA